MSCDSHEMNAVVEYSTHEHMGHEMSQDKSMEQANEMQGMNHEMPCCDDCECDYSNCHSPLMLSFNSAQIDYNGSSKQNPFNQQIHHKHLPSHPYRPPIG